MSPPSLPILSIRRRPRLRQLISLRDFISAHEIGCPGTLPPLLLQLEDLNGTVPTSHNKLLGIDDLAGRPAPGNRPCPIAFEQRAVVVGPCAGIGRGAAGVSVAVGRGPGPSDAAIVGR